MRIHKIFGAAIMAISFAFILLSAGCFSGSTSNSSSTSAVAIKPNPRVESVVATTSGTDSAYYTTLDIKVKNEGAEGTVLVEASVTQDGKTNKNQMPVFLKKGESHELKMTFPLTWEGGNFDSKVTATVP
jgi:subtilase family serine protease